MTVRIEFETDNDAFCGDRTEEICRVLSEIAEQMKNGWKERSIIDINGNRIGNYKDGIMEEDNTCEGYTNYETSTIGLEIDNDEGTQNRWLDAARNAEDSLELADELKESFEEGVPVTEESSVYSTLLNSAMQEINWQELAEDLIKTDREILTHSIEVGSTSSDSCKLEDIVAGIEDLLPEKMLEEFEMSDEEEQGFVFEEIFDYLNEIAPEGVLFGAQEYDGACFGFWSYEEEEEE